MSMVKNFQAMSKKNKAVTVATFALMAALPLMSVLGMPFAAEEVKGVLTQMIGIVGMIFQAVGVVLSVYSVGQLVLAFKNEDADSKSRASTMLVVGVCLIAIPSLINSLGLVDKIADPSATG